VIFANPNFGELRSTEDGDWWVDVEGVIRKTSRSVPWIRAEMKSFWEQVCTIMRTYGVTNRYPRRPTIKLVRVSEHRHKRVFATANHGLQVKGSIRKLKGRWDHEECQRFREEVSTLMRDQDLVLAYSHVMWVSFNGKDKRTRRKN